MDRVTIAASQAHGGFAGRYERPINWFSAFLIVLSLFLFARSLPLDRLIVAMKDWIDSLGAVGPFAFAIIYIFATVALVPASLLTIAAGAMFGLWQAMVVVSLASTTGAALAFLIARYLLREKVRRQIQESPKFAAIDEAIGREGWRIVALLRLSPAVPFTLQNYLQGLTAIRFWPYIITSWIAMLPGTFMYVYIGYLGGTGLEAASGADRSVSIGQWALRVIGFVATVAVTVYITYIARKTLRSKAALEQRPSDLLAESETTSESQSKQDKTWRLLAFLAVAILLASASVWTLARRDVVQSFVNNLLPTQSTIESSGSSH